MRAQRHEHMIHPIVPKSSVLFTVVPWAASGLRQARQRPAKEVMKHLDLL